MVAEDERWVVPADPVEVRGIRREVGEYALRCGLTDERVHEVRIAVTEAVTNSVLHAYLDGPAGEVEVEATCEGDGLSVVVRDRGSGMRPRADSPGAGLGLGVIARVTQRLHTQDLPTGGVELRMRFAAA
jgi:serine/threonine-protein kinase RsbW